MRDKYRHIYVGIAIAICLFSNGYPSVTFAQDPIGTTRPIDRPWMIDCNRRSCVSTELAASVFLRNLLMISDTLTAEVLVHGPAHGLNEDQWDTLLAYVREFVEADAAYQSKLYDEICRDSTEFTSDAQLAAALEDHEKLATQQREAYLLKLDSILNPDALDSVMEAIDDFRDGLGWSGTDYAMYFEMQDMDRDVFLARGCSGRKNSAKIETSQQKNAGAGT